MSNSAVTPYIYSLLAAAQVHLIKKFFNAFEIFFSLDEVVGYRGKPGENAVSDVHKLGIAQAQTF